MPLKIIHPKTWPPGCSAYHGTKQPLKTLTLKPLIRIQVNLSGMVDRLHIIKSS